MADASGPISSNLIIQAPLQLIFGTGQSSNDVYVKEVAGGLSISQPLVLTSATFSGLITNYNGIATIGNGIPALIAKADLTAQAANVGFTTLYAVPTGGAGTYRVSVYAVITQAASVSSTLPQTSVSWTDIDSNTTTNGQFGGASTGNTLGNNNAQANQPVSIVFNAKAGTNISYQTAGYASSGATPMQYAIHVKLEYLGA